MTEAELRAHRATQRTAEQAEAEMRADAETWAMGADAAIEIVDRRAAVSDRGALRMLIAEMVALRITGHTIKEIAEATAVSQDTVRRYLARAAETAERNDTAMLIDHHAVPMAVDNLLAGLAAGDKQYTLKVLEGRGHLAKHSKATTNTNTRAGFVFQWVGAPQAMPALPDGSVMGVPRGQIIEGEVVPDSEDNDK